MKSLIILLFVFVSCGEMERETISPMFYDMSRKFGEYTDLWLAHYKSGNRDSMMYYSGKCAAASEAMDYLYKKMYGNKPTDTIPKIIRTSSGDGTGGSIRFTIETDTLPTIIKWVEIDSFTTRYFEFIVTDSTGWVAKRDSAGNWHIKNAARALEIMYEGFLYDRRRPTKK